MKSAVAFIAGVGIGVVVAVLWTAAKKPSGFGHALLTPGQQVASLQEQALCSHEAEAILKSAPDYGNFPEWGPTPSLNSHFDPETKHCFAKLDLFRNDREGRSESEDIVVVDAFEKKSVARFYYVFGPPAILGTCYVHPQSLNEAESCRSKDASNGWVEPGLIVPDENFSRLLKKYGMQ